MFHERANFFIFQYYILLPWMITTSMSGDETAGLTIGREIGIEFLGGNLLSLATCNICTLFFIITSYYPLLVTLSIVFVNLFIFLSFISIQDYYIRFLNYLIRIVGICKMFSIIFLRKNKLKQWSSRCH